MDQGRLPAEFGGEVNPRTAEAWVAAHLYCTTHPVPAILAQEAAKRYRVAMRTAIPAKPRLRLPRGAKLTPIPKLKKQAWDAFSKWIRARDTQESGFCKCCTCDRHREPQAMQCGHFVSRVMESTLFDEQNNHSQCAGCNMPPNNGRPFEYAAFLNKQYGAGTADKIRARAHRRRLSRQELETILKRYAA